MSTDVTARVKDPTYQAFLLLRTAFTIAPILFGLDKFTTVMTDWTTYLAPWINGIVPGDAVAAMRIVGVIEIAAGLLVAIAPRLGGYVVAAWLAGIIVNLADTAGLLRHRSAGLRAARRRVGFGAPCTGTASPRPGRVVY
jgi:hypothetical protein